MSALKEQKPGSGSTKVTASRRIPVMKREIRTFEHLNAECRSFSILISLFDCSIVLNSKIKLQSIRYPDIPSETRERRDIAVYRLRSLKKNGKRNIP
jgi:hypothetical protein